MVFVWEDFGERQAMVSFYFQSFFIGAVNSKNCAV